MKDPTRLNNYFEELSYKEKFIIIDGFADRLADNIIDIKSCQTPEEYIKNLAFVQQDKDQIKDLVDLLNFSELNKFMTDTISIYSTLPITEKREIKVDHFYDAVRNVHEVQYNPLFTQDFTNFYKTYNLPCEQPTNIIATEQ